MRRSIFTRAAARGAQMQGELAKLHPLLGLQITSPNKSKPTVAALAMATTHGSFGGAGAAHIDNCPVLAKHFPLCALHEERSFLSRPCPVCLKERVHFLANEAFCLDFERRCGTAPGDSNVKEGGALSAAISKHFSSTSALKESLVLFSTSGMTPGRTWLVYHQKDGGEGMSVVNLSANQLPLAFGMWPLAMINMTEATLCQSLSFLLSAHGESSDVTPRWSRVARNPAARACTPTVNYHQGGDMPSLTEVRLHAARRAVDSLNWEFVEKQLKEAKSYFASESRHGARNDFRKQKEDAAARAALGGMKDSGSVVITVNAMEREAAKASEEDTTRTPPLELGTDREGQRDVAATPDTTAEADASAALPADDSTEPVRSQLGDGTWEYRYPSGDVTLLLPDGTQVFKTKAVTTTVYTNGSTLFEYPGGSSILDRADGVRITTMPDGTMTEEKSAN